MRRLGLLLFPVRERKKVFTAEKAMKLFKWFSLAGMAWGCGCGVLSGQDVVEPLMPNVDLEVQQFRKARAAILKYRVMLELCCEIISLERGTPSGDRSKSMFDLMPERFEADVLPFRLQYLLIMGGTNSLRGGEDPENVIDDLRYIGDKCRENGIKPVYLTLAPINPDNIKRYFDEDTAPDWKERFSTVNEWIRMQDHIDTAVLFADMDVLSPEYGADGIHIDWKGKFLMGQLINRELPKFKE